MTTVSLSFKLRWPDAIILSTDKGTEGIEMTETGSPNIIILDINLPDIDGFEVLKQVRLFSDVPIIILTVRETEVDKVMGFEMGTDDYIIKPFSPLDLLARVKAVLRRAGTPQSGEGNTPPFTAADLTINFDTREVYLSDERMYFTPTEYKLLCQLVRNEGRAVTQQSLRQQVWGNTEYVDPSILKKYIYQLRNKLGDTSDPPQRILNERGVGYKFVKPK